MLQPVASVVGTSNPTAHGLPFPPHRVGLGPSDPAVGIVDNGTGISGHGQVSYSYFTDEAVGQLEFMGGSFYSTYPGGSSSSSIGIQLNLVQIAGAQYYWDQNVVLLSQLSGNRYAVSFLDNVWNMTSSTATISPALLRGKGSVSQYQGQGYYWYEYPKNFTSSPPFNVSAKLICGITSGQPFAEFFLGFENSTYSDFLVYDSVSILSQAQSSSFVVGGTNAGGWSNDAEWVVAGNGNSSVAQILGWQARAKLLVSMDGKLVVVPCAAGRSLDTGEATSNSRGVQETWDNQASLVVQSEGASTLGYLWSVAGDMAYSDGTLNVYDSPAGGLWSLSLQGPGVQQELEVGSAQETISMAGLPHGDYQATLSLEAGAQIVFSSSLSYQYYPAEADIQVYSPYSFFLNGVPSYAGDFTLPTPVNLTFPALVNVSRGERAVYVGAYANGTWSPQRSFYLYEAAQMVASYALQAYVSFPFPVQGFVNGRPENLSSGWYGIGSNVTVLGQRLFPEPGEMVLLNSSSAQISQPCIFPLREKTMYLLRVNDTAEAYVNGTIRKLSGGYYPKGTYVVFPSVFMVNSTARLLQSAKPRELALESPQTVEVQFALQYLITLTLPNGTRSLWAYANSTLSLPTVIPVSSGSRYLTNVTQLRVSVPGTYSPRYALQYLITLTLPNGTRSLWAYANSTLSLRVSTPLWLSARWVGTQSGPNGMRVSVKGPLLEKAVLVVNWAFLIEAVAAGTVVFSIVLFLVRKAKIRPNHLSSR